MPAGCSARCANTASRSWCWRRWPWSGSCGGRRWLTKMTAMAAEVALKQTARERLLAAANELFYDEGIQTVGIDRIIEKAGVAKASLYNTFGSKDELIRAYLDSRGESRRAAIEAEMAKADTPRGRLLAVFDALEKLFRRPGFH